jgi:hypothetical protein
VAAFDWYQATVRAPLDDVIEGVMAGMHCDSIAHEKGHHGFAHSTRLTNYQDGYQAQVWHGGSHPFPHVQVTSDSAPLGAEVIRASFPDHSVSRVDVREDFAEEGAFDLMAPHLVDVARESRVKVGTAGDHLLTMKGRTIYLGAASSAVRLRMYDKAAELRDKFRADPVRLASIPECLTRVEAQVRPATKEAKERFAVIEPLQVMGSAAWLRDFWERVEGLRLDPVKVTKGYVASDDERALNFMLSQYGPVLSRLHADLGDWACVGLQIGELLEQRKRARC